MQEYKTCFARGRLIPHVELRDLELCPTLVATIPVKLTQKMICQLSNHLPLDDLKHLKRVRKPAGNSSAQLEIIITGADLTQQVLHQQLQQDHATTSEQQPARSAASPAASLDPAVDSAEQSNALDTGCLLTAAASIPATDTALAAVLPASVTQLLLEHGLALQVVQVPRNPPQTRKQWEEWGSTHWPMSWKIPEGAAPPTGDELLVDSTEQAYFESHLEALLGLSDAGGGSSCARIVDPLSNCVVSQASDGRQQHPLHHAAMLCIQGASERDLILWPPSESEQADAAQPSADPQSPGNEEARGCHKRPRLDEDCGALAVGLEPEDGLRQARGVQGATSLPPKPYMCTGYDCFLVHEPCVMCAMALVHSRLSRVVYCKRDAAGGALGGAFMLMKQTSLNHHYKAYWVPLMTDCKNIT